MNTEVEYAIKCMLIDLSNKSDLRDHFRYKFNSLINDFDKCKFYQYRRKRRLATLANKVINKAERINNLILSDIKKTQIVQRRLSRITESENLIIYN